MSRQFLFAPERSSGGALPAQKTAERPHGIRYALVFRPKDGEPFVRFDNAHGVEHRGGKFVKTSGAFDHWHRTANDPGRPYAFAT